MISREDGIEDYKPGIQHLYPNCILPIVGIYPCYLALRSWLPMAMQLGVNAVVLYTGPPQLPRTSAVGKAERLRCYAVGAAVSRR